MKIIYFHVNVSINDIVLGKGFIRWRYGFFSKLLFSFPWRENEGKTTTSKPFWC
ncbi:hypothetical protein [uncultured Gammaproteobacteria bacterium]|nr:hypothetical protein [uncultured Gammaproteobacteria bacterium]CAC9949753.1 hypothetical protein [uncultured Gammaproteobacteria bacterium]CAC9954594.1 hypothetical protein [uncultured Gammaproteobacteria bacterium]CAC9954653.1 hypothetical protein [uncultured Gammaproteobacteria bacterium]CAC9956755.1 hypothetical protein [uncultured Gammaproteobacteria bacterium]